MMATSKSLAYSAVLVAALSLASCSEGPQSTSASQPAAATVQRQFNVYFDVDKSGLTPEAASIDFICDAFAAGGRSSRFTRIVSRPFFSISCKMRYCSTLAPG